MEEEEFSSEKDASISKNDAGILVPFSRNQIGPPKSDCTFRKLKDENEASKERIKKLEADILTLQEETFWLENNANQCELYENQKTEMDRMSVLHEVMVKKVQQKTDLVIQSYLQNGPLKAEIKALEEALKEEFTQKNQYQEGCNTLMRDIEAIEERRNELQCKISSLQLQLSDNSTRLKCLEQEKIERNRLIEGIEAKTVDLKKENESLCSANKTLRDNLSFVRGKLLQILHHGSAWVTSEQFHVENELSEERIEERGDTLEPHENVALDGVSGDALHEDCVVHQESVGSEAVSAEVVNSNNENCLEVPDLVSIESQVVMYDSRRILKQDGNIWPCRSCVLAFRSLDNLKIHICQFHKFHYIEENRICCNKKCGKSADVLESSAFATKPYEGEILEKALKQCTGSFKIQSKSLKSEKGNGSIDISSSHSSASDGSESTANAPEESFVESNRLDDRSEVDRGIWETAKKTTKIMKATTANKTTKYSASQKKTTKKVLMTKRVVVANLMADSSQKRLDQSNQSFHSIMTQTKRTTLRQNQTKLRNQLRTHPRSCQLQSASFKPDKMKCKTAPNPSSTQLNKMKCKTTPKTSSSQLNKIKCKTAPKPSTQLNKMKCKTAPKPSSTKTKKSPAKTSRKPLVIDSDQEEEIQQMLDPSRILIASEKLEEVRPIQIQESGSYKLKDILPYLKILVLEFRKARSFEAASKYLEKPTNFQRFLASVVALLDEAIDPQLMLGQGVPSELCVLAEQPQGRVLRARCIPNELKLTPTFVKYLEHVHQDWWLPTVASAHRKETEAARNSQQTRKRSGSSTKNVAKKARNVDQKSTANNSGSSYGSSKNGSIEDDDVNGSQEELGNKAVKQESEEYAIPENVLAGSGIDTLPAPVIPPINAPLTTAGSQGTTENVQVVVKTEINMKLDDSDYEELPAEVLANLNLVPDV